MDKGKAKTETTPDVRQALSNESQGGTIGATHNHSHVPWQRKWTSEFSKKMISSMKAKSIAKQREKARVERKGSRAGEIAPLELEQIAELEQLELDPVPEKARDNEVGGDSSSFASVGSALSSASSAASATFRAVGHAARKGLDRKRLNGAMPLGFSVPNEFVKEKKRLISYRPLFPHNSPDPRLSEVYNDLCAISRVHHSFKSVVLKIFVAQVELGETSQLLISLTDLRFKEVKEIISDILLHFYVEWEGHRSDKIWYLEDSLLDASRDEAQHNGPRQVVHFLDFVSKFVAIDESTHAPLCIPGISDIVKGICLRYFILNTFCSVDLTSTGQRTKDTLYKKCQSVLDVLIGYLDDTDILHDIWPFTVQLMKSPASNKNIAQHAVNLYEQVFDRTGCPEIQRLLFKLCKNCDMLPTSLFVSGVRRLDTEATFGGGFADIYRASLQDEIVALKRLRIFLNDQERHALHQRFCREALIWKRLKHENILPFIGVDAESFPKFICMVSPWMHHGTLVSFVVARAWRVDLDNLLRGVISGLQYLHVQRVVHGDLRGSNILIDSWQKPCLADFGLTGFSEVTVATQTSNRNGSVRWMAPELHRPKSVGLDVFARTFATDIYAFACVCVEIYSGKPPFLDIREDSAVILLVIKDGRPSRPAGNPGLPMPDGLWHIVTACWRQQPLKRPKIAGVLWKFDHNYIGGWKAGLAQQRK